MRERLAGPGCKESRQGCKLQGGAREMVYIGEGCKGWVTQETLDTHQVLEELRLGLQAGAAWWKAEHSTNHHFLIKGER